MASEFLSTLDVQYAKRLIKLLKQNSLKPIDVVNDVLLNEGSLAGASNCATTEKVADVEKYVADLQSEASVMKSDLALLRNELMTGISNLTTRVGILEQNPASPEGSAHIPQNSGDIASLQTSLTALSLRVSSLEAYTTFNDLNTLAEKVNQLEDSVNAVMNKVDNIVLVEESRTDMTKKISDFIHMLGDCLSDDYLLSTVPVPLDMLIDSASIIGPMYYVIMLNPWELMTDRFTFPWQVDNIVYHIIPMTMVVTSGNGSSYTYLHIMLVKDNSPEPNMILYFKFSPTNTQIEINVMKTYDTVYLGTASTINNVGMTFIQYLHSEIHVFRKVASDHQWSTIDRIRYRWFPSATTLQVIHPPITHETRIYAVHQNITAMQRIVTVSIGGAIFTYPFETNNNVLDFFNYEFPKIIALDASLILIQNLIDYCAALLNDILYRVASVGLEGNTLSEVVGVHNAILASMGALSLATPIDVNLSGVFEENHKIQGAQLTFDTSLPSHTCVNTSVLVVHETTGASAMYKCNVGDKIAPTLTLTPITIDSDRWHGDFESGLQTLLADLSGDFHIAVVYSNDFEVDVWNVTKVKEQTFNRYLSQQCSLRNFGMHGTVNAFSVGGPRAKNMKIVPNILGYTVDNPAGQDGLRLIDDTWIEPSHVLVDEVGHPPAYNTVRGQYVYLSPSYKMMYHTITAENNRISRIIKNSGWATNETDYTVMKMTNSPCTHLYSIGPVYCLPLKLVKHVKLYIYSSAHDISAFRGVIKINEVECSNYSSQLTLPNGTTVKAIGVDVPDIEERGYFTQQLLECPVVNGAVLVHDLNDIRGAFFDYSTGYMGNDSGYRAVNTAANVRGLVSGASRDMYDVTDSDKYTQDPAYTGKFITPGYTDADMCPLNMVLIRDNTNAEHFRRLHDIGIEADQNLPAGSHSIICAGMPGKFTKLNGNIPAPFFNRYRLKNSIKRMALLQADPRAYDNLERATLVDGGCFTGVGIPSSVNFVINLNDARLSNYLRFTPDITEFPYREDPGKLFDSTTSVDNTTTKFTISIVGKIQAYAKNDFDAVMKIEDLRLADLNAKIKLLQDNQQADAAIMLEMQHALDQITSRMEENEAKMGALTANSNGMGWISYVKMGTSILSGILSIIPGVGTILALALEGVSVGLTIYQLVEDNNELTRAELVNELSSMAQIAALHVGLRLKTKFDAFKLRKAWKKAREENPDSNSKAILTVYRSLKDEVVVPALKESFDPRLIRSANDNTVYTVLMNRDKSGKLVKAFNMISAFNDKIKRHVTKTRTYKVNSSKNASNTSNVYSYSRVGTNEEQTPLLKDDALAISTEEAEAAFIAIEDIVTKSSRARLTSLEAHLLGSSVKNSVIPEPATSNIGSLVEQSIIPASGKKFADASNYDLIANPHYEGMLFTREVAKNYYRESPSDFSGSVKDDASVRSWDEFSTLIGDEYHKKYSRKLVAQKIGSKIKFFD